MEIYVNNQKIDVRLDNEKTLADIFEGIVHWVESNGKYVVSCYADGKDFGLHDMGSLSFQNVERMDFIIGEEIDVVKVSLEELDSYIDNVGNTLLGRDSLTESETRDLQEGMNWVDSMVTSITKLLRIRMDNIKPMGKGKNVEEILLSLQKNVNHLDSVTSIENFLEDLRDLKLFVLDLKNRTMVLDMDRDELLKVIQEYAHNIEKIKNDFISVNENFQSGKDRKASELLENAISNMNLLLTALISLKYSFPNLNLESITVDGEQLADFNKNMNEILVEIAQALEENDIIRAGDILEYELPEYLDKFKPYVQEIIKLVETTKNNKK